MSRPRQRRAGPGYCARPAAEWPRAPAIPASPIRARARSEPPPRAGPPPATRRDGDAPLTNVPDSVALAFNLKLARDLVPNRPPELGWLTAETSPDPPFIGESGGHHPTPALRLPPEVHTQG